MYINLGSKNLTGGLREMKRSVKIDVNSSEDQYKVIINLIKTYRIACRQLYSVLAMSEIAVSEHVIDEKGISVKPNKDSNHQLLTWIKNPTRRDIIEELLPGYLSAVWDGVKRDVESRWKSKDPAFPSATRGYLTINGVRDFALFNHIGVQCNSNVPRTMTEHGMSLRFTSNIEDTIDLKFGRLDGSRYYILKNICNNPDWKCGTCYVNEREGKLFVVISYEAPDVKAEIDINRILEVSFTDNPEAFIQIKGPKGVQTYDTISAVEVIAWIKEIQTLTMKFKTHKTATGNPRRAWGSTKQFKALQDRLFRVTKRRENGVKERDHLWSRRIVERAKSWQCGHIVMNELPKDLFGFSWQWYQFSQFLRYKIEEIGGKITEQKATVDHKKLKAKIKLSASLEEIKNV